MVVLPPTEMKIEVIRVAKRKILGIGWTIVKLSILTRQFTKEWKNVGNIPELGEKDILTITWDNKEPINVK